MTKTLGISTLFIVLFTLLSCEKEPIQIGQKKEASIGDRNELIVVVNDNIWNSEVGDTIRKYIARPVSGVINYESMFDITQINRSLLSEEIRKNRNILSVRPSTQIDTLTLKKGVYSHPQIYFSITYTNTQQLEQTIKKYADSITKVFHQSEINEEQHYINRVALVDPKKFTDVLGITIKMPKYYHLRKETDAPFLWYQKDLPTGDVNIVFYEFPMEIPQNTSEINYFFDASNTIGKQYIRNFDSTGYYKIDNAYIPEMMTYKQYNMQVYEIKGAYKMMNDIFYGPYVLYIFKDDYYKRYLFVQGFINDLNKSKRDHLMELEAIVKSINFFEESPTH